MRLASTEAVFQALAEAEVRFLVVGGLAVNVYGYQRFTKDIDLVLELAPENIHKAFSALTKLGYQPNIPVTVDQFADAETRRSWVEHKNMQVLQLWSDQHRETPIDLFVTTPFDFEVEYPKATHRRLGPSDVPIVSRATLIAMKRAVGRTQDLLDVEKLDGTRRDV